MKFKNPNAITLIALVITIIVLLILAGVALSLVLGENGITERAVNAGKTQNIAGAKEKLELEVATLAGEYYQAKYVNNNVSENSVGEYILAKLATRYPSNTEFCDGYKLEVTGSTVTLTATEGSDRTSVEGAITDDGKISFDPIVIASSTGTSTNTVANTTSLSFVDANSNGQADVREAVEYNIPYTDVYTGTAYTKDNGWLFLSKTEEGNGKYTVNLMSAGIPAKVYYHYNGGNLGNANNGWWGTDAQVAAAYPSLDLTHTYVYADGGCPNYYAAVGFEKNFASIPLYDSSTWSGWSASEQYNKGTYTSINGTSTGDVTGAIFKVAGSNVSVHDMTYTEANSLTQAQRNLGNNYWLASPRTNDRYSVYYVSTNGGFGNSTNGIFGVRPVVSISGVTLSE